MSIDGTRTRRVLGCLTLILAPASAAAHDHHAPKGASHGAQHSDERALREHALDEESAREAVLSNAGDLHALLRHEVEPLRQRPRGRIMVFASSGQSPRAAQSLEDAVVVALFKLEDLKPITASAAKREVRDLPPECQETGGCMAQLARHLGTNAVLTCRMTTVEATVTLELRVLDLERAEEIGAVSFARHLDDSTEDMVGPAVAALFAPPPVESTPVTAVAAPPPNSEVAHPAPEPSARLVAVEEDGPPLHNRVPFFAVAGVTSGTIAFSIMSFVVGYSGNRDETYQVLGFVLGGVSVLGLAATITLAVLTDFSKDTPDEEDLEEERQDAAEEQRARAAPTAMVFPWVSPQGAGASLALGF